MPIYEYICQDCHTSFEFIRSIDQADTDISCVKCQSENVRRCISLFNAASGGRAITGSSSCSGCTSSSCSICDSR